MPYLSVAGIVISVALDGAGEKVPEYIGSDSRTYAGGLRSTERAQKRNWAFTTKGLLIANAEAIRTACSHGAIVACVGDLLGDGVSTYQCRVTFGDAPMMKVRGGHRRVLQLVLREA
jgi:hypothetical protein